MKKSINKYYYISLRASTPFFKKQTQDCVVKIQLTNTIAEIKLTCIKGVLRYFGIKKDLKFFTSKFLKLIKK